MVLFQVSLLYKDLFSRISFKSYPLKVINKNNTVLEKEKETVTKEKELIPRIRRIHSDTCIVREKYLLSNKFCLTCTYFKRKETNTKEEKDTDINSGGHPQTTIQIETGKDLLWFKQAVKSSFACGTSDTTSRMKTKISEYTEYTYAGNPWRIHVDWDHPMNYAIYDSGGRLGRPREISRLRQLPGVKEEHYHEFRTKKLDFIHEVKMKAYEIIATWDAYKNPGKCDLRPHSWIVNTLYFTEPEVVVKYFDWLRKQHINVPSRTVVYHQNRRLKHLRYIPGDNVCLCDCCGPKCCSWTPEEHQQVVQHGDYIRAGIEQREALLREQWIGYEERALESIKRIREAHPINVEEDSDTESESTVEYRL